MQTSIEADQAIELAYELKTALGLTKIEGNGAFQSFTEIGYIKRVMDKLPPDCRFIVRYSGSMLPVVGWQANLTGGTIEQRASLNEPRHSFQGVKFVYDTEGYLCLHAGSESWQPWCRLSFGQAGEPGFELAILQPDFTSAHAEFI